MSKAVMQQALSAFEAIMFEKDAESCQIIAKNARYSLREELAQPEQKPFKPDWVSYRQGVADGAAQTEHNHLSDAMRLYQAVDRLATQAGEDAGETIDWLCGEHGGMFKLFEAYFSPKPIANPLANQTVASGSPIDSSTNIAVSSIDSSDSATRSADSAETFGKPDIGMADPCPKCQRGGVCRTLTCGRLQLPADHPYRNQA